MRLMRKSLLGFFILGLLMVIGCQDSRSEEIDQIVAGYAQRDRMRSEEQREAQLRHLEALNKDLKELDLERLQLKSDIESLGRQLKEAEEAGEADHAESIKRAIHRKEIWLERINARMADLREEIRDLLHFRRSGTG